MGLIRERAYLCAGLLAFGLIACAHGPAAAQGYGVGPESFRIYNDRNPPPPGFGDPRFGGTDDGPPRGASSSQTYRPSSTTGYPRAQTRRFCAREHGFCAFRGSATVRYGANGVYVVRTAQNGVPCNNRVFGDPAPGVPKRCLIDD